MGGIVTKEVSANPPSRKKPRKPLPKKRMVERFTREAFTGYQKIDSLGSFLSSAGAKSLFINYLVREHNEDEHSAAHFVQEVEKSIISLSRHEHDSRHESKAEPELSDPEGSSSKSGDREEAERQAKVALQAFGGFLASPAYFAWRAEEKASVSAMAADVVSQEDNDDIPPQQLTGPTTLLSPSNKIPATAFSSVKSLASDTGGGFGRSESLGSLNRSAMTSASNAFAGMDKREMDRIMSGSMWLPSLLAAAESLPMPFTLLAARPGVQGYPVVYSNPSFERCMGKTRQELQGATFLSLLSWDEQGQGLQVNDMVERTLSHSVEETVPVVISRHLTSGAVVPVYNNFTMKPVFDQTSVQQYVIGLLCVADGDNTVEAVRAEIPHNAYLIDLLPESVFVADKYRPVRRASVSRSFIAKV